MEREAEQQMFTIFDPEDGRYEKARCIKLIHDGVLNTTNAPGFVPVQCPPLNDPIWRFAVTGDLTGIHVLHEVYNWNDHFYRSYATDAAHLRKALSKITADRAYHCFTCKRDEFHFFILAVDCSQVK